MIDRDGTTGDSVSTATTGRRPTRHAETCALSAPCARLMAAAAAVGVHAAERRLIGRLRTPVAGAALSERAALQHRAAAWTARRCGAFAASSSTDTAHCLEAALAAAVILEQHGFPPLVLSFESIDELDHVIFVYQRSGRWGSIGRSRDPGLHGRKPVFATPRDARPQLRGRLHRFHRPHHRLRRRRSADHG